MSCKYWVFIFCCLAVLITNGIDAASYQDVRSAIRGMLEVQAQFAAKTKDSVNPEKIAQEIKKFSAQLAGLLLSIEKIEQKYPEFKNKKNIPKDLNQELEKYAEMIGKTALHLYRLKNKWTHDSQLQNAIQTFCAKYEIIGDALSRVELNGGRAQLLPINHPQTIREIKALMSKVNQIQTQFVNSFDNAKTGRDIAAALKKLSDDYALIMGSLREMDRFYPELKNPGTLPLELKSETKKMEEITRKLSVRIQDMQKKWGKDAEVQKAWQEFIKKISQI